MYSAQKPIACKSRLLPGDLNEKLHLGQVSGVTVGSCHAGNCCHYLFPTDALLHTSPNQIALFLNYHGLRYGANTFNVWACGAEVNM